MSTRLSKTKSTNRQRLTGTGHTNTIRINYNISTALERSVISLAYVAVQAFIRQRPMVVSSKIFHVTCDSGQVLNYVAEIIVVVIINMLI